MNNNIVSTIKNPLLDMRNGKATADYNFQNSSYVQPKKETINDLFEDFEQNFLEANLDKVISLEELKSIAEAIGKRDWGYVKYILSIICLILKSYQNISKHSDESILAKGLMGPRLSLAHDNGPKSQSALKLIIPEKRTKFRKHSDSSRETKAFKTEEINDQLMSLNKIFKKMKTNESQKNSSTCWSCQNYICTIHDRKMDMVNTMAFNELGRLNTGRLPEQSNNLGFSLRNEQKKN